MVAGTARIGDPTAALQRPAGGNHQRIQRFRRAADFQRTFRLPKQNASCRQHDQTASDQKVAITTVWRSIGSGGLSGDASLAHLRRHPGAPIPTVWCDFARRRNICRLRTNANRTGMLPHGGLRTARTCAFLAFSPRPATQSRRYAAFWALDAFTAHSSIAKQHVVRNCCRIPKKCESGCYGAALRALAWAKMRLGRSRPAAITKVCCVFGERRLLGISDSPCYGGRNGPNWRSDGPRAYAFLSKLSCAGRLNCDEATKVRPMLSVTAV